MEDFNRYVFLYKEALGEGNIQKAYTGLVKYVLSLKAYCSQHMADKYSFGNVSPGYMDYTYFPFFDEFLRKKKLRFGVVLNHEKIRFELWLMGQNAEVQKEYWHLLKSTKWNKEKTTMPKYSVLEVVLVDNPDFDQLDVLTQSILGETTKLASEIMDYLKANC
ncbi:hypothetical protein JGH11_03225 [Dysgonomonas sp. Marseille-P4677]|uniref:DUF7000 family protein n=1 Tax=Dysgonomonas sp. Marseille-P4677 TaxID=2364790 RepID=UPI001913E7CC|nr:hypothetical protein [Dysgonomonas sp. Marseille-P4677]MBK5719875.1 hypothetical protein [Dysgonomonas sp. Marseille-P4677]